MRTRINNLFFLFVLVCILYGIGFVYWNENLSSIVFLGVTSILVFLIISSKDFYEIETYEFFRENAFIILMLNLSLFFMNKEYNPVKAAYLALNKATFGVCFFWFLLWFNQLRKNNIKRK